MRRVIFLLLCLACALPAAARQNGLDVKAGKALISVTALRDDVLRVRIGPAGTLPPDESWAALAQARDDAIAAGEQGTRLEPMALQPRSGTAQRWTTA